jgi:hypothetical protein
MSLEKDKYFCWVLPEDDNIDFWSTHFNEYVRRLMTTWAVSQEYGERFLAAEKWFHNQMLSSSDWFKESIASVQIIH